MTISMYEASVPVFKTRLKALAAVLGEGERNAAERKIDPQVFLTARLAPDTLWANISNDALGGLAMEVVAAEFAVVGKSMNKEEFVTCGGVRLSEVDFKTMESRLCPGLHFAGELLDIDGVTGGFNFQAAWTTGLIAGSALALPATMSAQGTGDGGRGTG